MGDTRRNPTRQPTTDEATAYMRPLIDAMTDPVLRFDHPEEWGLACSRLAVYVTRYPEAALHRRTAKNIGKRRAGYLIQFIKTWNGGVLP